MSKKAEPKNKNKKTPKASTVPTINLPVNKGLVNLCEFTNEKFHNDHCLGILSEAEISLLTQNTMASNGERLGHVVYKKIDVRTIYVDTYQRHKRKRSNMGKLIAIFNIDKTGVILLSYRNGKFLCPEGAHRVIGAIANGEQYLMAVIYEGLTKQQEAHMFATQNDNKTSMKPEELYNAGLEGDVQDCIQIEELCKKYHISVLDYDKVVIYPLQAITAARNLVTKYGIEVLDWVLGLMRDAEWLKADNATSAKHLQSLARVYTTRPDPADRAAARDVLLPVLYEIKPDDLGAVALAMSALHLGTRRHPAQWIPPSRKSHVLRHVRRNRQNEKGPRLDLHLNPVGGRIFSLFRYE